MQINPLHGTNLFQILMNNVLIIDINSLTGEVLERIDKSKFREARNQIFNKFVKKLLMLLLISTLIAQIKACYRIVPNK